MSQSIPLGLTKEHILCTLAEIDDGVAHPFGKASEYELVHENKHYAPMAVVGLACRYSIGRTLRPDEFSGSEDLGQANYVLRKLGFNIVPKRGEGKETPVNKDWAEQDVAWKGELSTLVAEFQIDYTKALPIAIILGVCLMALLLAIPSAFPPSFAPLWWSILWLIGGQGLAHECTHWIVARCMGTRPRIGLGWLTAHCTFPELVRLRDYIMVAASPVAVLSVVFCVAMLWEATRGYAVLALLFNAVGSVGDLYMISFLLSQQNDTWVEDTKDGCRVYRIHE